MKCILIRAMRQRNPEYSDGDRIQAQVARRPYDVPKYVDAPAGTEIENPDAWRLVRMGVAVPADEECAQVANVTPEQTAVLAAKYEKLASGRATGDPNLDRSAPACAATDPDDEDDS
jgi:hypothetical protein